MSKALAMTVLAVWTTATGFGQVAFADAADAAPTIQIHLRNYAQVDQKILERAGEIASRIFDKAGIKAMVSVETEQQPVAGDTTLPQLCHIYVEILSKEMAQKFGRPANTLGIAPGSMADLNRTRVFVFDHVAQELAHGQAANRVTVLGHAVAHEIGHILLHMAEHSHEGIMQTGWGRQAMERMASGRLNFSSEESQTIRGEVARRTRPSLTAAVAATR